MSYPPVQFSTSLLLGLTLGTACAAPIVLAQFEPAGGASHEAWTAAGMLGFGVYLLFIAAVGTWTSLGLMGVWAGRRGGRLLRLAVQVLGIIAAAALTLPCAFAGSLLLMAWAGQRNRSDRPS